MNADSRIDGMVSPDSLLNSEQQRLLYFEYIRGNYHPLNSIIDSYFTHHKRLKKIDDFDHS
jgi:hypothetical protein